MKRELTVSELKCKAEAYCSVVERCESEVEAKLDQWGASPEYKTRIMAHLCQERYLDAHRFCEAFVRDKYRFNQWGRVKIVQALRLKRLPTAAIAEGLEAIDEAEYRCLLMDLLQQKRKGIKARSDYERDGKLIRFALGRGFEMDIVRSCLKQVGGSDEMDAWD